MLNTRSSLSKCRAQTVDVEVEDKDSSPMEAEGVDSERYVDKTPSARWR